ncbi:DnaJ-like protein [Encephalitozoon intestinalis ATCC 50506]|uniref:DnaJ-like protein n=1 Tax=Encephalitozoon intestinalis (strain ATCC 50506) TaxID=876142 RepID=E0S801_ENCIT|nr:DnaJ-like protein [Encephalitozoon intestinalis ATCC 50506]ADM11836.1 DnaJ-like protein [Encephalitozoon intestinalis ATCC 50506]UTX45586.1 DnaJ domain-containing protein [Encephalitozoon intestinalis]
MPKRKDPYKTLGVKWTSSGTETKEAYRRLQRLYHPDSKTGNKEKYEEVCKAYEETLKDPPVEIVPIKDVARIYKGSQEEVGDIIALYNKYKGKMGKIVDNLLLSDDGDEERLRGIIDELIGNRTLKQYCSYSKKVKEDPKRRRRKAEEERMARQIAEEMGIDLDAPLEDILGGHRRREERLLISLEERCLEGPGKEGR